MAFMTAKQEKAMVMAGMGVVGYSVISKTFSGLPQLPSFVTNTLIGQLSIVTIAAGITLYGIWVLSKY